MDFIERLFGLMPDGGSRSLELAFALVPITAALMVCRLVWRSGPRK